MKEAVQVYLACISFADAQLGRVLDALEKTYTRILSLFLVRSWLALREKKHYTKVPHGGGYGFLSPWLHLGSPPLVQSVNALLIPYVFSQPCLNYVN